MSQPVLIPPTLQPPNRSVVSFAELALVRLADTGQCRPGHPGSAEVLPELKKSECLLLGLGTVLTSSARQIP